MQNAGLNGVKSSVISLHIVVVLRCLPVIAQDFCCLRDARVVACNRPCFAAGSQILAGIKAECGGLAHRPCSSPGFHFPGKILGAMRLAGIFHHNQLVLFCNFQNRVHVGSLAIQVDGNNCGDASSAASADKLGFIQSALVLHIFPEFVGIEVIGPFVNIEEFGESSRL